MTTNNIISTPDITGNIGSCTSNSIVVETGNHFGYITHDTIVTNSCTGGVTQFSSWSLGAPIWVVLVIGILIFWMSIADKSNNRF